ncbi:transporter substrate-binding domain-containing protein [Halobacteriovorax sp. GB3]|uniref:transporter substrate-binding domain-containing protein n=1 Tax=Halobacteriovorax sp. GB3 TaxID=2719615 RepID=UPI00235E1B65|nr:transporter substrate-binding domain-containing protein [Halobacteriovorax sp. GB3]MDD0854017.1 transporter substrate-binding domain-containing protein [Halobacteriovorax sp. GB3]
MSGPLKRSSLFIAFLFNFLLNVSSHAFKCTMAMGYPPFQYLKEGVPSGIDPDIVKLFNQYNPDKKIEIYPMEWSDAIGEVYFGNLYDCVIGIEKTKERLEKFHFTNAIYYRFSTLFVLSDSETELSELVSKRVAADEGSYVDHLLRKKSRLVRFNSKRESFLSLKQGHVKAAIAPLRVGKYLAKELNLKVSILLSDKEGVPVSIATRKREIRDQIAQGLKKIPKHKLESSSKKMTKN